MVSSVCRYVAVKVSGEGGRTTRRKEEDEGKCSESLVLRVCKLLLLLSFVLNESARGRNVVWTNLFFFWVRERGGRYSATLSHALAITEQHFFSFHFILPLNVPLNVNLCIVCVCVQGQSDEPAEKTTLLKGWVFSRNVTGRGKKFSKEKWRPRCRLRGSNPVEGVATTVNAGRESQVSNRKYHPMNASRRVYLIFVE